ncbi:polysaccharide pyruvyl transferase family protein [Sphingomonas sp. LHG3406-1]|uniref:polysaccharide pyruvyl transferase family protein n=1 Tax=Sphingomonas sp. LHG3406-1 TaxID=2804617 RepID=UPI0026271A5F|nr:polysaccharide pyruvyl transferase family protein [Sphingomonas sp. LHG3406-1]
MSGPSLGILTFHKCINYGSYWQARCLAEGLEARGATVELLDHHCPSVRRAELRCALEPTLPERTPAGHRAAYKAKTRLFEEAFAGLPLSETFSLHDAAELPFHDAIVVGSDEVWNLAHPWYSYKPLFYGETLKTDRLISYAASFGNYDAARGLDAFWAERLARFSSLSVRDENSREIVAQALGTEPPIVLDPCLAFADRIPREAEEGSDPYALVYGHGFPDWLAPLARDWARSRGLRLRSIGYGCAFADEEWIEAGPLDFARAMAGAAAVITNFFHGCVFALAMDRPFVACVTPYRLNKVRDLTAQLGAERHLLREAPSPGDFAALLGKSPSSEVHRRIADLRTTSTAFLDAALA